MKALYPFLVVVAANAALASSSLPIDDIAGVYKGRFQNGSVDGTNHSSEDILEIVKVSPSEAYMRVHLEFFNGHLCSISGVAKQEGDMLVYRPYQDYGEQCALGLREANGKLVFSDPDGNCRVQYCGARGSFQGMDFPLKSRRSIGYMKRLLDSREYAQAIAERDGKK
jgi:hypothetical protein